MASFVESLTSNNTGSSFGVVLNKEIIQMNNLFGIYNEERIIFYDLVRRCIVRNSILEPDNLATVKYCKLKDKYKPHFKRYISMVGGSILQTIAQIRAKYNLTSEASEFVLLAFYIVNGDQEAISAHQIWRNHSITIKESMIDRTKLDAELDIDNLKRDQLPYLSDKDIEDLKYSGFFVTLDRSSFKIDKTNFYNDIFINKQIAYQQLVNTFTDVSIKVKENTYKVCNITDRAKAADEYWDSIGGLAAKHQQVIAACEYAINDNLVGVGLNKIIANAEYEYWIKCMNGTFDDVNDDDEDYFGVNVVF